MENADIWPTIHTERQALAADLRTLGQDQWTTTSLCADWTVRDVLAHMTATAKMKPAMFFPRLASCGFKFTRLQEKGIAENKGHSGPDTLAGFDAVLTSLGHPPGPMDTMLGEAIVHSEDIRRPLGIKHDYPVAAVTRTAQFFTGSNLLIGAKRRISGLTLRATDTDWSHGTGPEVTGPVLSLLMAMTGRKAAIDDLAGDGAAALRERP